MRGIFLANQNTIRKTPLDHIHRKLGARMIEFAGYEMPVWYTSQIDEHMAVRKYAGVFDLTHMGELFFRGPGAKDILQKLTTNNVAKLNAGQAQYSVILNRNAGIRDDVIVYRINETDYMMVVNAANQVKIDGWVKENFGASVFENLSYEYALVALQGPKAQAILDEALESDHSGLEYFGVMTFTWRNVPVILARTGYTGEDGFEIIIRNQHAEAIWNRLFEVGGEGLKPVGLGARDTLRLEVCYSLYGNELEEDINPLEAGLGWVVKLKKGEFIGRDKLQEIKDAGLTRKIRGMAFQTGPVPRHANGLFKGDKEVGYVTSGCLSPVRNDKIALGYLPNSEEFEPGSTVDIEMHNRRFNVKIVETPFYKRSE